MLVVMDKEVDGRENSRRKAGRWDSLITIINDRFQPYNIRGWFWASSLQSMGETNVFNGRKVADFFLLYFYYYFHVPIRKDSVVHINVNVAFSSSTVGLQRVP